MEVRVDIEEIVVNSIVKYSYCDFCGNSYKDPIDKPITRFSIEPGYGSCMDNDRYTFDICDRCLSKLLAGDEVNLRSKSERYN